MYSTSNRCFVCYFSVRLSDCRFKNGCSQSDTLVVSKNLTRRELPLQQSCLVYVFAVPTETFRYETSKGRSVYCIEKLPIFQGKLSKLDVHAMTKRYCEIGGRKSSKGFSLYCLSYSSGGSKSTHDKNRADGIYNKNLETLK